MNKSDYERVEDLMRQRDNYVLIANKAYADTMRGLADEVPGLLAEVRRLEAERDLLRATLLNLYDATANCTKHACVGLRNGISASEAYTVLHGRAE